MITKTLTSTRSFRPTPLLQEKELKNSPVFAQAPDSFVRNSSVGEGGEDVVKVRGSKALRLAAVAAGAAFGALAGCTPSGALASSMIVGANVFTADIELAINGKSINLLRPMKLKDTDSQLTQLAKKMVIGAAHTVAGIGIGLLGYFAGPVVGLAAGASLGRSCAQGLEQKLMNSKKQRTRF